MAKALGIGGIFFKSDNAQALASWYQQHLGLDIDPSYGGCSFSPGKMPASGYTVFAPFSADTQYFEPSKQPFMINLVVDDIVQAVTQVKQGGAKVLGDIETHEQGKFAWFLDPDGNKIELWQPSAQ